MLLEKLKKEVADNLTNEQFGVEALARNVGMSRSQLHRKLSVATGQSVSQFIREYRLQVGMELLQKGDLTAAEVAHRIGFGSATYFNKCFHEYYGFPPGEMKGKKAESARPPLHLNGTVHYARRPLAYHDIRRTSIAVLPFRNLSADHHNQYFSEGVAEAIRTGLSQIGEIRVISRTSTDRYRKTRKHAREIAAELGVSALLEGSIQRSDNRVRIDVRLINGDSEDQVWAKSFDRELEDVFAIQAEIAGHIATELTAKLSAEEKSKLSAPGTRDPKAYDLFLKGIYEFRTYTNQGAHNAIHLMRQAIALDRKYAAAYGVLAYSYIGLATIWGAEAGAREALQKAKPHIDRALSLDPNLDMAHMLLGFYRLFNDWDFQAAEAEYKLAIASDDPDALAMYIDYLNFVSRHEEAMALAERLNANDPYYPNSRMVLTYVFMRRFEEAMAFSESRLKMFNNYSTLDAHAFLLLNMKRYKEAIACFKKAIAVAGIRVPRMLAWMGAASAKSGAGQKALEIIDEFKLRLAKKDKASIAFFIAVVYASLDDKRSALIWLKKAYRSHEMEMPWLMTEPQFYSLHAEPEFQSLAARMGFDQPML